MISCIFLAIVVLASLAAVLSPFNHNDTEGEY